MYDSTIMMTGGSEWKVLLDLIIRKMFTYGRIGSVLSVSASVKSVGTLVIIDWPTAESATNKMLRFQAIKPRNFNQQCFVLLNSDRFVVYRTSILYRTRMVWLFVPYEYSYYTTITVHKQHKYIAIANTVLLFVLDHELYPRCSFLQ